MSSALGGASRTPPNAARLHHVALGTRDVETLAEFYCRLLQIAARARHLDDGGGLRSVWLELSGVLLMIERADTLAQRSRVEGVGLGPFLLAFSVTAAERGAFEERALMLGAPVESRLRYTSYLRDPDGNRIAISEFEVLE